MIGFMGGTVFGAIAGSLVTHLFWLRQRRIERRDKAQDTSRAELLAAVAPLRAALCGLVAIHRLAAPDASARGLLMTRAAELLALVEPLRGRADCAGVVKAACTCIEGKDQPITHRHALQRAEAAMAAIASL
jgi:hypothetical protein